LKISIFRELQHEKRVAITPTTVKQYAQLGIIVQVESELGHDLYSNADFTNAGAVVLEKPHLYDADIILQVKLPDEDTLNRINPSVLICYIDPLISEQKIALLKQRRITTIGMEFIPRTTIAQKMDALSSQANLAGYMAMIIASERLNKAIPMMMTPAGTISPAKVFVIGAGVAGLQAIATAKRLGARVEAFDTRHVVEEQVQSLGAKFLKIDIGETSQTQDGYATQLTPEQIEMQQTLMASACSSADIVITTAQVFGRPAPQIISTKMIQSMKSGSIIIDLAVESGGNVAGIALDQEIITDNGVRLIGLSNLPGRIPKDASEMYASNLFNLVHHIHKSNPDSFVLPMTDDIIKRSICIDNGNVTHPLLRNTLDRTTTDG
jgi:NAD(P) transhydrogenase subunit alpha